MNPFDIRPAPPASKSELLIDADFLAYMVGSLSQSQTHGYTSNRKDWSNGRYEMRLISSYRSSILSEQEYTSLARVTSERTLPPRSHIKVLDRGSDHITLVIYDSISQTTMMQRLSLAMKLTMRSVFSRLWTTPPRSSCLTTKT